MSVHTANITIELIKDGEIGKGTNPNDIIISSQNYTVYKTRICHLT